MEKLLSIEIPGYGQVAAPSGVPTGGIGTAEKVIQLGITFLLIGAIIIALIFIIFGGIKWITSSGDKQKVADARKTLIYAIIGLGVSFLAIAIIVLLGAVLGINLLSFQGLSP